MGAMNRWQSRRKLDRRQLLRHAALGGVGIAGLATFGCSSSTNNNSPSNNSTAPGLAAATQAAPSGTPLRVGGGTPSLSSVGVATPRAGVVGTGKAGGTLNVAAFADVNTLDPHGNTADDLALRSTSLFEGLVTQDQSLKYVPGLAESWQASPDAVEWTFKLRQGIKFHDGTPCDATAVKANFDRANDPKNALVIRANALTFFKEAQVVDPLTLTITHVQPDGAAPANVGALPILSPTAFNAVSVKEFGQKPIGTGPFKFKEWAPDDHITVERFDDYWGGKAKLDAIVFKIIADENTRVTAVKTGEIDFIPRISLPLLNSLQSDKSVQVVETIPVFRTYFGIGNHPKFSDARVRQAVVRYGCPRADIVKQVYLGHGEVAVGPVPSVSEWYIDYTKLVMFDPNKAKSLLAEAGAQNLAFSMIYPAGDSTLSDALTVWQSALKSIGVTMSLNSMDNGAFLKTIVDPAADYDVCFAPSQGPIGDFQVIRVTHRTGAGANISHNSDPQLDQLIDKAQATLDFNQRKQIYDQAFRLIIDDSKQYYVTFYPTYRVLSKRVSGYTKENSTYYRFNNVTVQ